MENNENRKQGNSSFWKGVIAGLVTALLITCMAFVSKLVLDRYQSMARLANLSHQAEENGSVVNERTEHKMQVLQDTIEQYFMEEVTTEQLDDGIYRGMLESLDDPYSVYYSEDELRDLQEQTKGIYYGVGAYVGIDQETGYAQFSKIIPGTPAEEAALQSGDYIYQVEGEDMQGKELSYVVGKIKGEEGSKVTITIVRMGTAEPFDVTLERKEIESPTVTYQMFEHQIAYISIAEFDTVTTEQFKQYYKQAEREEMKGLILDLRDNPGGNLTTVTEIAREILPKGMIVYTEDKYGERMEYTCDGVKEIEVPLIVLVNGNSASASEILAGAVKDYGIGTLMGTTTYGKGIVQRVISLSDGTAVKLTVSKYYTPKGNNIHKIGIEPDVEIAFDAEQYLDKKIDNQLETAKKTMADMIQEQ